MAHRVYHWKHGWIPLDRVASSKAKVGEIPADEKIRNAAKMFGAGSKQHRAAIKRFGGDAKALRAVPQAHLPRSRHITAAHRAGRFGLQDKRTGHTTSITERAADHLQGRGHMITAVHGDGGISTFQGGETHHLDRDSLEVAAVLVDQATAREPALTTTMEGLASTHGGQMEGLDFRVKTADSLARKLSNDAVDSGKPPAELAGLMFDVNRYTISTDDAQYAASAQAAIDDLRRQGNTVRVKNFWNRPDNPYQGINLQVTTRDGAQYELQINTPASLAVKNGRMHRLYEQFRIEHDEKAKAELEQKMYALSRTIPVPPGVESVS
jgi:hypothetical protein